MIVEIDPLFDDTGAAAMVELCERFGRYRLYAEHEQHDVPFGRGLVPRHDRVRNFLRQHHEANAAVGDLIARTSYFREEYAYGGESLIDGIEKSVQHPALLDAARTIHGLRVVEPAIAYANLYLPGQELAVHTDVPEFRGANRKAFPQWLLVVMHHSGLFDEWRLPIVAGIAYFHETEGGALVYWPDGHDAPAVRHHPRSNSAIVLDTDTVFHGVERAGDRAATKSSGPVRREPAPARNAGAVASRVSRSARRARRYLVGAHSAVSWLGGRSCHQRRSSRALPGGLSSITSFSFRRHSFELAAASVIQPPSRVKRDAARTPREQ